jgi:hypothetical protein
LDSHSLSKTISINLVLWYVPEDEVEEVVAGIKEKLCEVFAGYEDFKTTVQFNIY